MFKSKFDWIIFMILVVFSCNVNGCASKKESKPDAQALIAELPFWNPRGWWCNFDDKGQLEIYFCSKISSRNGILLPKLFRPTVRKKCSSDCQKLLKF